MFTLIFLLTYSAKHDVDRFAVESLYVYIELIQTPVCIRKEGEAAIKWLFKQGAVLPPFSPLSTGPRTVMVRCPRTEPQRW